MFGLSPQPTPFDLHWRMFGIDVRVHPFFWVMAALIGWGTSSQGMAYLLLWILCVFVSVLIHELGHVVMGRIFGSYGHILLYSFGGLAFGASDLRHRWQRILVLFAGPAVQFVLLGFVIAAGIVLAFLGKLYIPPEVMQPLNEALWMLALINLAWPILNLIPIYPLDGGQIAREVLEGLLGQRGVIAAFGLSLGLSVLLAVQMVWPVIPFFPYRGGMYMAIFFALMAVTSYQMLQMELARSRWRGDERQPWE